MAVATHDRFAQLMRQPEERIDLAEAALLIAGQEYPDLPIPHYLAQIDEHAQALSERLRGNRHPAHMLAELNRYLFEELGFMGDMNDYYNPKNSFINEVLDRRLGVPISLSLIYLEIGRRIGLPLEGIAFPGHFLVRLEHGGDSIVIDPFMQGAELGREDLERRLDELFSENAQARPALDTVLGCARKRDILLRMLRNLKAVYYQSDQYEKALAICDMIFTVTTDEPVEIRDRGTVYLQLECWRAALADYQSYLMLVPDATDRDQICAQLLHLKHQVTHLN